MEVSHIRRCKSQILPDLDRPQGTQLRRSSLNSPNKSRSGRHIWGCSCCPNNKSTGKLGQQQTIRERGVEGGATSWLLWKIGPRGQSCATRHESAFRLSMRAHLLLVLIIISSLAPLASKAQCASTSCSCADPYDCSSCSGSECLCCCGSILHELIHPVINPLGTVFFSLTGWPWGNDTCLTSSNFQISTSIFSLILFLSKNA